MEWHPIISGLLGGIVAMLLINWGTNRTRDVAVDANGWRTLRPGGMLWATIAATATFSLLLFYVYFFVGSSLPDADEQMAWCLGLAVAFLALAGALVFFSLVPRIAWKADRLWVTGPFSRVRQPRFADIVSIEFRSTWHVFRVGFRDGTWVDISPLMHGSRELLLAIEEADPTQFDTL